MSQSTTISPPNAVRSPEYTIYKPNRSGRGGAVSFSFNRQKEAVFVEAANQKGEKQFDWEHKIIMKWGLTDLGSILAALQLRKPNTKLFHQTEKASSACSLNCRTDSPDQAPFYLTISKQDTETKAVKKVAISLTDSEAAILETAIRTAIGRILAW